MSQSFKHNVHMIYKCELCSAVGVVLAVQCIHIHLFWFILFYLFWFDKIVFWFTDSLYSFFLLVLFISVTAGRERWEDDVENVDVVANGWWSYSSKFKWMTEWQMLFCIRMLSVYNVHAYLRNVRSLTLCMYKFFVQREEQYTRSQSSFVWT